MLASIIYMIYLSWQNRSLTHAATAKQVSLATAKTKTDMQSDKQLCEPNIFWSDT